MSAGMGEAGQALQRKVGPLPLGVWLLGIGGGLAVALYLRRDSSSSAPASSSAGSGWSTSTAPGAGNLGTVDPGGEPADSMAGDTNQAWLKQAAGSDLLAATALQRWLNSEPLTAGDQAVVSAAISRTGLPPWMPAPAPVGGATADTPAGETISRWTPADLAQAIAAAIAPPPAAPIPIVTAPAYVEPAPAPYVEPAPVYVPPAPAPAPKGTITNPATWVVPKTGSYTIAQFAKNNGMTLDQFFAINPGLNRAKVNVNAKLAAGQSFRYF